jgi:hypothetical protein
MSYINITPAEEVFIIFIGYVITLITTFYFVPRRIAKLFIFLVMSTNWGVMYFFWNYPVVMFCVLLAEILIILVNAYIIICLIIQSTYFIFNQFGKNNTITATLLTVCYLLFSFIFSVCLVDSIFNGTLDQVAYISCFCVNVWERSYIVSIAAKNMGLPAIYQLLPFTQVLVIILFFLLIFCIYLFVCVKIACRDISKQKKDVKQSKQSIWLEWFILILLILMLLIMLII